MTRLTLVYSDQLIKEIFNQTKTIALVGASNKRNRASFQVMEFLLDCGYIVYPVNPILTNEQILAQKCYPNLTSLSSIGKKVDMVDIFRSSEQALDVVQEAIAIKPKVIWLQLGVINFEAKKLAEQSAIKVIMDRCPKIEFERFNHHQSELKNKI